MSGELNHDTRFSDAAFEQYRLAHGIPKSQRLGDMPIRVISEILRTAQELKAQGKPREI
jgi:hypothetical protein